MTVYGYARVSTNHQDITPQIEELKRYGCEVIYQEKVSGISADDRRELMRLIETAQTGDKIVFTKLDRFARSTVDALNIAKKLNDKGVAMVVLNFGGMQIDISTPTGKLMLTMFAGFAEFERELMLERQRVGIERAKKAGKYRGRIRKYTEEHPGMNHAIELYQKAEKTVKEICASAATLLPHQHVPV
ncbi:recombinase family protein [Polycladomyces subterraneus]|uniref:Recombinase family protein n=1 Tax=Polycladomyces subterraneus TaxID=1016997 RepID=A0ABT8IQX5_9BACL|nr:recombinase family protein [Polycladomyces subterraneus]MDN4595203.1 recombinase family protein [Polycladomyces subterraneus]